MSIGESKKVAGLATSGLRFLQRKTFRMDTKAGASGKQAFMEYTPNNAVDPA
jgi:hypothetical protein